ncbi:MAG: GDP-mannose 4,6-dehydratase [Candidatus Omnitrophica bacterium]|nr:GDP-mannose 4,6-dehydratase [Candidatus Omnitrophota bacterium]
MSYKRKDFWKNKKVFITGHEGFLGSWLAKILLSYGAKITGIDKVENRSISMLDGLRKNLTCIKGNMTGLRLIRNIIEEYRPEIVFHLAAQSIVGEASKTPVRAFKSNIEGTWNILEACRDKKYIKSIVIASSDKAYGESNKLPYTEEARLSGNHPYDVSKSCADLIARTYFHAYNLPVCITRCGNIFGPGDFHFSRIVPDTVRSALRDKTLLIRSDGTFTRDYVYVEDIVDGYILLAEKLQKLKLEGEAFNFSNEKPLSVINLVKKIYQIADKKPSYRILGEAKYEIKHQYLSSQRAKEILGWEPKYNLEEGLKRTINWYKKLFADK